MNLTTTKVSFALVFAASVLVPYAASASAVIDLSRAVAVAEEEEVQSVDTRFNETGKFLALVPVKFTVTVRVSPDGSIALQYPWYSNLTVDKRDKLSAELKVAVDTALHGLMVGKVAAEGGVKKYFSAEEASAVSTAVGKVLEENFGTEAN